MNDSVVVIVVVVGMALVLSIPGALAFVRSANTGRDEHALERRVRDLEAEVAALRKELDIVRSERDRQAVDLAGAKARIVELERLTAAYERMGGGQRAEGRGQRSEGGGQRAEGDLLVAAERYGGLVAQLADYRQQLAVLDKQIAAAGGPDRAPVEKVTQRQDALAEVLRLERELDAKGRG